MAWKRLTSEEGPQRDLIKWNRESMEVEGIWKGTVEGEYGDLGQVEDSTGTLLAFPLLAVLERTLTELEEGTHVRILYLGKRLSQKSGRQYKAFDVFIEEEEST